MKSTGIVRKVDGLGRVVIPNELRKTLDIHEKTSLEIYIDGDKIILKKFEPSMDYEEKIEVLENLQTILDNEADDHKRKAIIRAMALIQKK